MSFRFLHTADWHVGKSFVSISDGSKRERTRLARIEVVERLGALARAGGARAILVAGDLFDYGQPSRTDVTALCAKIGALGLPVHAIPGRHDSAGSGCVWEQPWFEETRRMLCPNFHLHLMNEPIAMDGGAVLFPCPSRRPAAQEEPVHWLRDPEVLAGAGDAARIVLAHGDFREFAGLPDEEIDYLGLGDWHGVKMVAPKAWYPGTPETDGFARDFDYLPGHALMVTVARGGQPVVESIPTGGLHWQVMEFEFAGWDPVGRFEEKLDAALANRVGRDHLKLVLTGQLGRDEMERLENRLGALRDRVLGLELDHRVGEAPATGSRVGLAGLGEDPLVGAVISRLCEEAKTDGGEVAGTALRDLDAALRATTP